MLASSVKRRLPSKTLRPEARDTPPWPAPVHLEKLRGNAEDVDRLWDMSTEIGGGKKGPTVARDEELKRLLNKSALVLVVACWEAYVEDLATAAFDFMFAHAPEPTVFPNCVLTAASSQLRLDPDERKVWALAGEGWREVMSKHRAAALAEAIEPFHSPRAAKVDALFKRLVGIKALSSNWHWKGTSAPRAAAKLDNLINRRGLIAHRVNPDQTVSRAEVDEAMRLVWRVAVISSNRVAVFVNGQVGVYPWGKARFHHVS